MKALVFAATALVVSTASAADIYISPNIYWAAGPASANYFINIGKISAEVKKVTDAELGKMSFEGASVNTETGDTTYNFHRYEGSDGKKTCWSEVKFTTAKQTEAGQGPTVTNVQARLNCSLDQD